MTLAIPEHWPHRPEVVLFDLDGTLADTAGDLGGALNQLRADRGLPPLAIDQLRPYASAGAKGLIGAGLKVFPDDPEFETLRLQFLAYYERCLSETTVLFEGVAALLEHIETRGQRWGVVTNKPHRYTLPVLDGLGLLHRSSVTISGDSTSHAKPHPLPLLTACEQLDVTPSRTLYVGDDLRDIQAARAAGMPNVAAAWGYLGTTSDIAQWQADIICQRPLEIADFLA